MTRRTKRSTLAVAILLFAFLPFQSAVQPALGDALITNSGKRFEGTVIDEGDHYVLVLAGGGKMQFAKGSVREVIKDETAPDSELCEFLQTLRARSHSAGEELRVALRDLEARQKEEREDWLDPGAIAAAEFRLKWVSQRIDEMKRSGAGGVLGWVHAERPAGQADWVEGTSQVTFSRDGDCEHAGSSLDLDYGRNSLALHVLLCATRDTAPEILRKAEKALKEAKTVPKEVIRQQEQQLRAYAELRKQASKLRLLVRDADRALRRVSDKPESLKAEVEKWDKAVLNARDRFLRALADAEGQRGGPAEVIGYVALETSSHPAKRKEPVRRRFLVVGASFPSELFMPSIARYREMQAAHHELPRHYRRTRTRVATPDRFHLLVEGRPSVGAIGIAEWGEFCSHAAYTEDGALTGTFSREGAFLGFSEVPPPRIALAIVWEVDVGTLPSAFSVQLDNLPPLAVPKGPLPRLPGKGP